MRAWQVGGALIRREGGLVLVANRRRDDSVDWTPPGGVIDHGESLQAGLIREVREETGLVVDRLLRCAYRVEVQAPEMGWVFDTSVHAQGIAGEAARAALDWIDATLAPPQITATRRLTAPVLGRENAPPPPPPRQAAPSHCPRARSG